MGTAAQPEINGNASNGTKGEKVEMRVRSLDPSPCSFSYGRTPAATPKITDDLDVLLAA
jgi:hypothetical protein